MKNKINLIIIILFAVGCGSGLFAQENLLKNPSFEQTENNVPSNWEATGWKREADISALSLDAKIASSGKNSVKVVNMKDNHAYYIQPVTVQENSIYRFSAKIKTENVDNKTIGAAIGIKDKLEVGGDIRATSQGFVPGEIFIRTGNGITSLTVLLSVGWYGALNTGTGWFDDVSLVKVDSVPAGAVVTSLEVKKAEPQAVTQTQPETQQNPGSLVFFLVLGGIVVLAGLLYLILVVAKKKDKAAPDESEAKKDETTRDTGTTEGNSAEEGNKQE